ncbi:hypothetical protein SKAU_G00006020 [Synaphobranchus kaupii]|uniref:Uncharacterized protein n=1 Tax=Synaphobranchus kaupii TaxID=118154 RepID=A0A9Q1GAA9_SYNKA|nr:hypothetical protein SKAU_G00006020 [Synaphobranchus kaupii]
MAEKDIMMGFQSWDWEVLKGSSAAPAGGSGGIEGLLRGISILATMTLLSFAFRTAPSEGGVFGNLGQAAFHRCRVQGTGQGRRCRGRVRAGGAGPPSAVKGKAGDPGELQI